MICQKSEFMSTNNYYEIAYEHASSEIAEINEQIQRLTRRKELLEKLLEPLKLLVPESGVAAMPATVSHRSNTEFSVAEAATPISPVVLVGVPEAEPGPLEALDPVEQPDVEEPDLHARRNGRAFPHEDIAGLAYRFWNERGQIHGHHEEDWFRAAGELQNAAY
jgi:hypothetical protein